MRPTDAEVAQKVRQWLDFAEEDLRLARHGFSVPGSPPYRLIAYHAQQCVEKYLKAYLVVHGIDFPFTHNIARLLELVPQEASWTEQLRDAEELTPYVITARYPGEDEEVTEDEARRALDVAVRVQEVVRRALADEEFPM
jgi:HEPN domain-containing protein